MPSGLQKHPSVKVILPAIHQILITTGIFPILVNFNALLSEARMRVVVEGASVFGKGK